MTEPRRVCLPPDPNPRPPGWTLPPGACDTHFHLFGPPDRFPYSPERRYEPPAAPLEHYMAMRALVGLSRGVIVLPTAHGTDNATVVDALARSDGTLLGVCNFDDDTPDAELDRLDAAGVRGARFSLMSDRAGAADLIDRAVKRMVRLGWSLDLHIEPERLLAHETFIRALPLPVVIDHMARVNPGDGLDQPAFRLLLDLLGDDRFWVKVSCADKISGDPRAHPPDGRPWRDTVPFARAAIGVAPGRVLWGSDWPHGNTFVAGRIPNDGDLLDLLAEYAPDPEIRRRILVDNPARLYGFPT
jgi:predicted TIM-barrel fold metal-dependent hydrolase